MKIVNVIVGIICKTQISMKNPVNKRNKKYDGIPYSERKRRFIGITCATLKKQVKKENILCFFFSDFVDSTILSRLNSIGIHSTLICSVPRDYCLRSIYISKYRSIIISAEWKNNFFCSRKTSTIYIQ